MDDTLVGAVNWTFSETIGGKTYGWKGSNPIINNGRTVFLTLFPDDTSYQASKVNWEALLLDV